MDEELKSRGAKAELFVVVGALMAIAYDARRSTTDVDAVFAPSSLVRKVADVVGERLNLEPNWLNDGVRAFVPGPDPDQIHVYEGSNLSVAAASPKFLLAMKLLASRPGRDLDDIRLLYDLCGFTTADEGLALVEQYYPRELILPRVHLFLQEMLQERGRSRGSDLEV